MNHSLLSGDYINEHNIAQSASQLEHRLLFLVASRDEDAFAELYHRYSTMLYAYLLHMVQDQAIAEDLIQEVFLAVWKSAARFRGQSTVKTWLYKIAHHQAVSWLRRHTRSRSAGLEGTSMVADPNVYAQKNWVKEKVRQALQQLSSDHRAVVELTFYHELSYQEIADIMDCPVGTVKSRMSYARRYLNQYLHQAGLSESG